MTFLERECLFQVSDCTSVVRAGAEAAGHPPLSMKRAPGSVCEWGAGDKGTEEKGEAGRVLR